MQRIREFDCFQAVARLADNFDVRLILQYAPEPSPHQSVIVNQQN
jgi:hypothetical protein